MATGNECPACGRNIGIWAVFRAPLPNRVFCPHCGERLRYGDTVLLVASAVVLLVLGGVAGVALAALAGATGPDAVAVAGVTFGAGAVATEVGFVLALWYGGARLERANPPPDGWDDEPY
jgi:hypothetical protein